MSALWHLLYGRPGLVADHAEAYAQLAAAEAGRVTAAWRTRLAWSATALCALTAATVLAGVAVMLWAVAPSLAADRGWVLVLTPLPPLVLALGCLLQLRDKTADPPFAGLRQQLCLDLAMLRELPAPSRP